MGERIIQFTGDECTHCKEMEPIVKQVEDDLGITFTKLEIWHNSENAAFMKSIDKDDQGNEFCGGIPFFYNERTGAKICGNTSFEKLKEFAAEGPKLQF